MRRIETGLLLPSGGILTTTRPRRYLWPTFSLTHQDFGVQNRKYVEVLDAKVRMLVSVPVVGDSPAALAVDLRAAATVVVLGGKYRDRVLPVRPDP